MASPPARARASRGAVLLALAAWLLPSAAARAEGVPVDRAVVRFLAPETGGAARPRFIFERELAFEARLEALAERDPAVTSFEARHVRAAVERHVAEELLAHLPVDPPPSAEEMRHRMEAARAMLEQRVGGREPLVAAARAEGITDEEILALVRRAARASFYLERVVAPTLALGERELRAVHRTGATPFRDQPFERIAPALRRWYVAARMGEALESFFQSARARVELYAIPPPGRGRP